MLRIPPSAWLGREFHVKIGGGRGAASRIHGLACSAVRQVRTSDVDNRLAMRRTGWTGAFPRRQTDSADPRPGAQAAGIKAHSGPPTALHTACLAAGAPTPPYLLPLHDSPTVRHLGGLGPEGVGRGRRRRNAPAGQCSARRRFPRRCEPYFARWRGPGSGSTYRASPSCRLAPRHGVVVGGMAFNFWARCWSPGRADRSRSGGGYGRPGAAGSGHRHDADTGGGGPSSPN
jgi:hypothetical protein